MSLFKDNVKNTFRKITNVEKEAILRALTYIMAAFGLVAALAWNEAISELINQYFKSGSNIISKFIYAGVVTFVAVIISLNISRIIDKEKS